MNYIFSTIFLQYFVNKTEKYGKNKILIESIFCFVFFKLFGNIGEFPNHLQTFWPTSQIPNFFQIFQTCKH